MLLLFLKVSISSTIARRQYRMLMTRLNGWVFAESRLARIFVAVVPPRSRSLPVEGGPDDQVGPLGQGQVEQVGDVRDEAGLDQSGRDRLAQALNVHAVAAREVGDPADGRAGRGVAAPQQ